MDQYTTWQDKISFFIELGKPLSKAKTIRETLDAVMYQVGLIFEPVNWSLLLKDSGNKDLVFAAVVGPNKDKIQGLKLPKTEGIAGHIYTTGEPLIVEDVSSDARFSRRIDKHTGFTTQSIIGVPLKTEDSVFGVIELINKVSGDQFNAVELKVLSTIAEYAAIAIERSYYYQSLKRIALIDSLTGLKNKASFNHTLSNRRDLFERYEVPSTLLFISIVQFREINDQHGYETGDKLLVRMGKILKGAARRVDEVFRYEADKFIVLMPHTLTQEAKALEQRILEQVDYQNSLDDRMNFQISTDTHTIEGEGPKELMDVVHSTVFKTDVGKVHMYSERMEDNLQTMLDEEKEEMPEDEKNVILKGKQVSLSGTFVHFNTKDSGHLTIKSISSVGVGFETGSRHLIAKEDLLYLSFVLDDKKRSPIKRQVIIKNIDGRYYEGEFYNPPPYDKALGFYLIN
ncbi:MAG: sensor domain-containing diguanylate cyclase [Desulfobacteraceae bacterium]|nr:MAG: sensor domain-containing diguanylate cyclase [Desulfobacteraceae bacterium]